jgi:hypothetical protein
MEKINLIASGYEWECPKCKNFQREIEATLTVTCKECKNTFEVDEVYHAWS